MASSLVSRSLLSLLTVIMVSSCNGGGGGEPCAAIEDDPEPQTVKTVRVTNSTAAPLWLPAAPCGDSFDVPTEQRVRFEMMVDGVPAVDVAPPCARCSSADVFCPSADAAHCCEGPGGCVGTIRIGPGESYDLQWQTYVYPKVELPADCTSQSCGAGAECRVGRVVEAGAVVEMRLRAVVECEFDDCGECPAGQTCVLTSSGACEAAFGIETQTSFELVLDDSIIELEFTA